MIMLVCVSLFFVSIIMVVKIWPPRLNFEWVITSFLSLSFLFASINLARKIIFPEELYFELTTNDLKNSYFGQGKERELIHYGFLVWWGFLMLQRRRILMCTDFSRLLEANVNIDTWHKSSKLIEQKRIKESYLVFHGSWLLSKWVLSFFPKKQVCFWDYTIDVSL